MYYLGVAEFCKDLYNQEDLVDYLRNDDTHVPAGALHRSHGWKEKITDNPVMNSDVRNLGLIGTADSVPYFKDKKARRGVPFMLRVGNLPPEIQLELRNCHLVGLLPNEEWLVDEETDKLMRKVKKNSTLYPMLLALADELNNLYVEGVRCVDVTRPLDHEERHFTLRVVLLYWCHAHIACIVLSYVCTQV